MECWHNAHVIEQARVFCLGVQVEISRKENLMGEEIRCKLQQIARNQLIQNFSLQFEEFESCLLENNLGYFGDECHIENISCF